MQTPANRRGVNNSFAKGTRHCKLNAARSDRFRRADRNPTLRETQLKRIGPASEPPQRQSQHMAETRMARI